MSHDFAEAINKEMFEVKKNLPLCEKNIIVKCRGFTSAAKEAINTMVIYFSKISPKKLLTQKIIKKLVASKMNLFIIDSIEVDGHQNTTPDIHLFDVNKEMFFVLKIVKSNNEIIKIKKFNIPVQYIFVEIDEDNLIYTVQKFIPTEQKKIKYSEICEDCSCIFTHNLTGYNIFGDELK